MKKTEAMFLTEQLKNVVDTACVQFRPWSIMSADTARELTLEPDKPSKGWTLVTLWEPDDE